jgi:hypothetical protein
MMFNVDPPNGLGRLLATIFMWGAATAISMTTVVIAGDVTSGTVFTIAITLTFTYAATNALWKNAREDDEQGERRRKRADRLAERRPRPHDPRADLLLSLMTPDELDDFKERLKAQMLDAPVRLSDEGELDIDSAVESLLDEASYRYQDERES